MIAAAAGMAADDGRHKALFNLALYCEHALNKIELLNEINTIPGFTKNSMFPMLWEASGLKIEQLVAKLVDISLDL